MSTDTFVAAYGYIDSYSLYGGGIGDQQFVKYGHEFGL